MPCRFGVSVQIDYVEAENAPEERRVAPNPWATLSVHVVASPASHGALEWGGLSVRNVSPHNCDIGGRLAGSFLIS